MDKPIIAFIGRVAHEKTRSDQFLIDILSDYAEVVMFRRENLSNKELEKKINNLNPQQIIFYQLKPSVSHQLLKLKNKNFIWIPMWDGFKKLSLRERLAFRYYNVRVLCFSRCVYDYVASINLKSHYAQYFPNPIEICPMLSDKPPYTILLWQRIDSIGADQVVKVVGETNIAKLIIKTDHPLTRHYSFPVEKITGWLSPVEYFNLFKKIDFYFAPRFQEGIGFSFLEALGQGIPVIGHDDATMNEYIRDGKNSLLFDNQFNLRSELVNPVILQNTLVKDMKIGHQQWQASIDTIISFILG